MIVIVTISEEFFQLNGIQYARIYQPLTQGSSAIGIYNIYDTQNQLVSSTNFSEYSIDGVVYANQPDTIAAILNAVWSSEVGLIAANTLSINNLIKAHGNTRSYLSSSPHSSEFPTIDLLNWFQGTTGGFTHVGQGSAASYNKTTGTMMSVFRAATLHSGGTGKFYMTKSTDGGATWSVPNPLAGFTFDPAFDYKNHIGGFTSDGRYTLLFQKRDATSSKHLFSIYSDDEGATWSSMISVISDYSFDGTWTNLSAGILEFENGDIGFPIYQIKAASNIKTFGLAISKDGGQSYSEYRVGAQIDTTIFNWAEPSMIHLDTSTLICVLRGQDTTAVMHQYITKNNGITWDYQGVLPFDSSPDSTFNDFLPKLKEVTIFGNRIIELIYMKRETAEAKRILARAEDLAEADGHLNWNVDTLLAFYTAPLGQNVDGNASVIHPNGNFRGYYITEDQTNSSTAQLVFISTPNDIYDVATKLGIAKSNEALSGSGAPNFTPHWEGQSYADTTANKGYIATGTTNSADWEILN